MTRAYLLSALLVSTVSACAPSEPGVVSDDAALTPRVSFRLPLIDAQGHLLSEHNKDLAKVGLAPIPDYIVVTEKNGADLLEQWSDTVAADQEKVPSLPDFVRSADPEAFGKKLCYEGDGTKVGYLSESLTGNFFADMFSLWGWRYKDRYYKLAENDLTIWNEWRGNGEATLLVYTTNEDGDFMTSDIVSRCFGTTPPLPPTPSASIVAHYASDVKAEIVKSSHPFTAKDFTGNDIVISDTKSSIDIDYFLPEHGDAPESLCYRGSSDGAQAILNTLLGNTDGNGDHFLGDVGFSVSKTTKQITVDFSLIGEDGETEHQLELAVCK